MADTTGMADIRGINISKTVTGFALQEYKFKELCLIESSSVWEERYYQETATELTGGTGASIEGVPRLSNFPYAEPSWTRQISFMKKHACEAKVSMEDMKTNAFDTLARTTLRISRAIAKSVDDDIFSVITENVTPVNINTVATTYAWDAVYASGADIIKDINAAKEAIAEYNYNPDANGYLLLSPHDYGAMVNWLISNKGANIPQFSSEKLVNGNVGELLGLTIKVSNSVTADYAVVVVAKECATYKEVNPLQVVTIEEPGICYTIRAWEIGVTQLKNPRSVCLITNTQF